jgi:hypothetical protein
LDGRIVLFALLALYLSRTEPERDTADTIVVAARGIADNSRLPVVADFGRDLPTG